MDRLHRHVLVVAFEADDLGMAPHQFHHAGGVRTAVDHVTQAHHAILRIQVEAVEQCSEGRQVAVDITHDIEAMTLVETGLQICLE